CFMMLDRFSGAKFCQDLILFRVELDRNEAQDGLTHHLLRGITENAPGAFVPGGYDAVQVFADNGVIRGRDNRAQKALCISSEDTRVPSRRRCPCFRQSERLPHASVGENRSHFPLTIRCQSLAGGQQEAGNCRNQSGTGRISLLHACYCRSCRTPGFSCAVRIGAGGTMISTRAVVTS